MVVQFVVRALMCFAFVKITAFCAETWHNFNYDIYCLSFSGLSLSAGFLRSIGGFYGFKMTV